MQGRCPEYEINISLSKKRGSYLMRKGSRVRRGGIEDASVNLLGHQTVNLRRSITEKGGHQYTVSLARNPNEDDLILLDLPDQVPCDVKEVAIGCGKTFLDVERLQLVTDSQQKLDLITAEKERAIEKAEAVAREAQKTADDAAIVAWQRKQAADDARNRFLDKNQEVEVLVQKASKLEQEAEECQQEAVQKDIEADDAHKSAKEALRAAKKALFEADKLRGDVTGEFEDQEDSSQGFPENNNEAFEDIENSEFEDNPNNPNNEDFFDYEDNPRFRS